ncbi:MAG TPA: glycosyltransferase [Euryarchaeota archaeon]|nr:glycosyltransferase [Euryarchaeota archaeon]
MRILMLLSNPFVTDARVYQEALSLTKAGHRVTVLAFDKHPEKGLKEKEKVNGIRVVRFSPSICHRGLNQILLKAKNVPLLKKMHGAHDLIVMREMWKDMARRGMKGNFHAVHCHDLDTLPAGVMLKDKLDIPLVYDSHEIFPWMLSGWLPSWIVKRFSSMEKRMAPLADSIITVTPIHEHYFKKLKCKNVVIVTNCKRVPTERYLPSPCEPPYKLLYIGNLRSGRMILDAMKVCSRLEEWHIQIGGYGHLEEAIAGYSGNGVEYIGAIKPEEVLHRTLNCDLVLALYDPSNPNNRVGPSNKLFEAMACGRPCVVATGTYASSVVEKEQCGYSINYSSEALATLLKQLAANPQQMGLKGKNALICAKEKYNWEIQETRLTRLYETLKREVGR